MEEIEVNVRPNSSSLMFYCIEYRKKKRFNLFNPWIMLVEAWDGATLTFDQPVLFEVFEDAVEHAKKLKDSPKLIDDHYEEETKKYRKAELRRKNNRRKRDKSIQL